MNQSSRRPRTSAHVFETPGVNESRFLKEAGSLLRSGLVENVVLICRPSPGLPADETITDGVRVMRPRRITDTIPRSHLTRVLFPLRRAEARLRYQRALMQIQPVSVWCHSLPPLPACVAVRRTTGIPLLYDAHELETERNGITGLLQQIDRFTEARFIRKCDEIVVVTDGIADWYARTYGILRPTVVRNIPDLRQQASIGPTRLLRERFHIPQEAMLFIYQGGLFRGRRVEQFLRVFARARGDRQAVFMGYGELEGEVLAAAAKHPNIHFMPAVPPAEVVRHTAGADVGLVGAENVCLSHYYGLGNKAFEYLLAGLPALVPDYPEMSRVVAGNGCGWVVGESDDAWLERVNHLTWDEVAAGREAALTTAPKYSWQNEERGLLEAYRRMTATRAEPPR